MKNALINLPFYKGKSIMMIEPSIGIKYGVSQIFIQFKFAPRDDYKSKGQWDEKNAYWLTSYNDLYNLTNNLNLLIKGKIEKYEFKNPGKKTSLQIRRSTSDKGDVYIVFHFFRDSFKVNTPLTLDEAMPVFNYFKNLIENFNTVSAIALLRNDVWFKFFGKSNDNSGGGNYAGNSGGSGNSDRSGSSNRSGNSGGSTGNSSGNGTSFIDEIDQELNNMTGGDDSLASSIDDDVPF